MQFESDDTAALIVASLKIRRCEIMSKPIKMNVVPVKEELIIRYAQGNNNKPNQTMKTKRSRLSQSSMRMNEPPT